MKRFVVFILAALGFLASSCRPSSPPTQEGDLARVGGEVLTVRDLPEDFASGLSAEDSSRMLTRYVDEWIRRTVLYQAATEHLGEDNPSLNGQILDYRKDLYVENFERDYLAHHMDTVVSEEEKHSVYEANREAFRLRSPRLRLVLAIIDSEKSYLRKLRRQISDTSEEGISRLASASLSEGYILQLTPEEWYSLSELNKFLPFTLGEDLLARGRRTQEVSHGGLTYLLHIEEWVGAGEYAPIRCVDYELKRMILQSREARVLRELEVERLRAAEAAGRIEKNLD